MAEPPCALLYRFLSFTVRDVRVSPALTFKEMSANSRRYLEASGEWELVDILGETSILQFGIDEWDIITFWVRDTSLNWVLTMSDQLIIVLY